MSNSSEASNGLCYLLGDWLVSPAINQIEKQGRKSHLHPMTMGLLVELLDSAPDVVLSTDLLAKIWGKVIVDDSTIHRRISQLRTALGDSARNPRYIATVPKRGYRIVASVKQVVEAPVDVTVDSRNVIPFAGRKAILAKFEVRLSEVDEKNQSHSLFVTGPPGIGKTRTTEELSKRARAVGWVAHFGWCEEIGAAVPFLPWTRILRSISRVHDQETITEFQSEYSLLHRILPDLYSQLPAQNVSRQLSQQDFRFRLGDAISRLLSNVAKRQPLLIIIDDLHNADEGSLEVLAAVLRANSNDKLITLCAYRDHVIERNLPVWRVLSELPQTKAPDRFQLRGLDTDELSQAGVMKGLSTKVIDEVVLRTDGNPLYVNILARSMSEESDSYSVVPNDLREMIMGQLSGLKESTYELLMIASCIARQFSGDLLSIVGQTDINEIGVEMAESAKTGMLDILSSGQYRFAHLLIQETIYAEIAPVKRRQFHSMIADSLARLSRNTMQSELLMLTTRQYLAAEEPIECARWTQKAFLSLVGKDDSEAVALCLRALAALKSDSAIYRENPAKVAAWTVRTTVNALHRAGPTNQPVELLESLFNDAVATAGMFEETNTLLPLLYTCFSDCLSHLRESERAITVARDACRIVESTDDEAVKLHARMTLIPRLDEAGRMTEAYNLAQDSIKSSPHNPLVNILGQESWYPYPRILIFIAKALALSGDPVRGLTCLKKATLLLSKSGSVMLPEKISFNRVGDTLVGAPQIAYECSIAGATCYYYLGETEKLAQCAEWNLTAVSGEAPIHRSAALRLKAMHFQQSQKWEFLAALASDSAGNAEEFDLLSQALILEAEVQLGQVEKLKTAVPALMKNQALMYDPEALIALCRISLLPAVEAELDTKKLLLLLENAIDKSGKLICKAFLHELSAEFAYRSEDSDTGDTELVLAKEQWISVGSFAHAARIEAQYSID